MAFEAQHGLRVRALGAVLVLAGAVLTVRLFGALPDGPLVYVLAYVPSAVLLSVGSILAFGGISARLFG